MRGPIRGGPFPTLHVSWDPSKLSITSGEVGRKLLEGEPRIMSHAEGEGHSFVIRPVALKPGEYKIVAQRLLEIFRSAGHTAIEKPQPAAPSTDISGAWDADIEYEVGSAHHRLFLTADGNSVTGSHSGWKFQGDLRGAIDGSRVQFRTSLPAHGTRLTYRFTGAVEGDKMSGEVSLGEYGVARWQARRHIADV
jgi:L-seryl-tRNA(Ser) seleniumtransferase